MPHTGRPRRATAILKRRASAGETGAKGNSK
jgi:hypothetical protein